MKENMDRGLLGGIIRFFRHDLWRIKREEESPLQSFGIEALRTLSLVVKGAREDQCGLHAAALTYATLMALVPFLVILFAIGKAIGFNKAEQWLLDFATDMPEQIQTFITRLLEIVQQVNPAALGAVGGVVFLLIIYKLLNEVEESFNRIWRVASSRSVLDKIRNYLSVLVIAPALALLANGGSAVITAFAGRTPWLGWVLGLSMQAAPVFLLTMAFIAVFMFLPNTRVRFRAALVGGLASALAVIILQFVVLKFSGKLFHKYAIYGSFASIPIFLFWLHLNWTILLFGAELAFAIQNRNSYAQERFAGKASMQTRIQIALMAVRSIIATFEQSEKHAPWNALVWSRENLIPFQLLKEILDVLTKAGLITKISSTEEAPLYALLCPPAQITPAKIQTVLLAAGASPAELGLSPLSNVSFNAPLDQVDPAEFRRGTETDLEK
jgi:membrane protein